MCVAWACTAGCARPRCGRRKWAWHWLRLLACEPALGCTPLCAALCSAPGRAPMAHRRLAGVIASLHLHRRMLRPNRRARLPLLGSSSGGCGAPAPTSALAGRNLGGRAPGASWFAFLGLPLALGRAGCSCGLRGRCARLAAASCPCLAAAPGPRLAAKTGPRLAVAAPGGRSLPLHAGHRRSLLSVGLAAGRAAGLLAAFSRSGRGAHLCTGRRGGLLLPARGPRLLLPFHRHLSHAGLANHAHRRLICGRGDAQGQGSQQ